MKIFILGALLVGIISGCTLWHEDHVMSTDEIKALFADDLKSSYPDHVRGCGVADGEVIAVRIETYCPFRTALCGQNPTCTHPKREQRVYDIRSGEIRYASTVGLILPPVFKGVTSVVPLEKSAPVLFSFYNYTTTPPQIATLIQRSYYVNHPVETVPVCRD